MHIDDHHYYMGLALELALEAGKKDEVPVGAIIVLEGHGIVASAYNLRETTQKSTAHAELLAIEAACQALSRWRLQECTLYVTLEPCFMCAGAIVLSRIPRVVYGAQDPKGGAAGSLADVLQDNRLNHLCQVLPGVRAEESALLLKDFFRKKRTKGLLQ